MANLNETQIFKLAARLAKANGRRASDQIPAILKALTQLVLVCGMIYLIASGYDISTILAGLL